MECLFTAVSVYRENAYHRQTDEDDYQGSEKFHFVTVGETNFYTKVVWEASETLMWKSPELPFRKAVALSA